MSLFSNPQTSHPYNEIGTTDLSNNSSIRSTGMSNCRHFFNKENIAFVASLSSTRVGRVGKCTFQILGVSGSADRGRGDNSIQFINIGKVGDKSFNPKRIKGGHFDPPQVFSG